MRRKNGVTSFLDWSKIKKRLLRERNYIMLLNLKKKLLVRMAIKRKISAQF